MFPFLSRLDKKYPGKATTITVLFNWWGRPSPSDAKALVTVQSQVKGQGIRMDYTVAADRVSGQTMEKLWLTGCGANASGYVFIIDKEGKIAYAGHDGFIEYAL